MSLVAYGSSDTDSSGSSSSGSGSGGEGPAPAQPAQAAQPAPRAQARLQAQLQAQAPLHQLQAATPGPGPGPTITRARAPRGNKRRQAARVHIHIHAPELGEASDSDDEGPFQKKSSPASAAGMGLSALLPQPRNLTLKETNRTLLPHAFTRPPKATGRAAPGRATVTTTTTPSPSAIKAASKNAAKQLARHIMNEKASDEEEEEDEDEEAEGGELSFFSLSDREQPPPPAVAAARTEAYPCVRADQSPPPCPDPADPSDVLNPADAPLEFNRSVSSLGDAGLAANSAPELGGQYPDYHGQEGEQSKYYQNYYDEYYQGLEPAPTPAPEEEHDTFMNDEAFKRLQGKRNRGKEEVSFVEIKGDDQLSGSQQWLMKSLTEEKDMKSFSKKRGEQPTSQQRRKHQITYLIHQAKERELELKNAWSDNRLTKRQTQAKYGF